jgi:hypothetical protein
MEIQHFTDSLSQAEPPPNLSAPLTALWWEAKGDWARAHALVDEVETRDGMAVHAYLHRKEGSEWNADYWYRRSGRDFHRPSIEDEWTTLVHALLSRDQGLFLTVQ